MQTDCLRTRNLQYLRYREIPEPSGIVRYFQHLRSGRYRTLAEHLLQVKGDKQVQKNSELVAEIKKWVDEEYAGGRVTVLTDDEIVACVNRIWSGEESEDR